MTALAAIAGVGSALVAGFYAAFTFTVMPALRRRPAQDAAATMVSINEQAVRPPFMILFFGTALACAGALAEQAVNPGTDSPLRILGSVAYLAGWFATMAINVPLNGRLARSKIEWTEFDRSWSRANLLRAVLSAVGSIALLAPL
ncbi:DUF1772 domain-containing protein [Arthrobacter ginkgonis]|uniref:DUF1772 domain-containing protein n=1 Tax=Arthrobacter ginkgonis TaxID=1630594 RepID=A0ABP7BP05_9MICC